MPPTNRSLTTAYQALNLRAPFAGCTSVMDGGAPASSFGCSSLDSQEQGWINDSTGSLGDPSILITPCFTILPGVQYTALIDIRVITISGPVLDLELQTCAGVIITQSALSSSGVRSIQRVPNIISTNAANVRIAVIAAGPDVELSIFSLVLNRH